MTRIVRCTVFLAILFQAMPSVAKPGQSGTQEERSEFSSRILTLTDVVVKRHIDPPARQQMILDGVKALYVAAGQVAPNDLSERVSELATQDQIAEFLDQIRGEFSELGNVESILSHGLLSAVPGQSYILEAKESQVNEQVINNRYVGTGIALTLNREEGLSQITRVFHNGPAWVAGIKSNDLILEIDGDSTKSSSLAKVVEALRGEAGSDVEVVVRQPGSHKSRTLTMTRNRVFIPSVEGVRENPDGQWDYTVDSDNGIALLRFKSIGPSTLHELRQISTQLRRQRVTGIVIDLREGGGILHDIVMVADSLIDDGAIGEIRSLDTRVEHKAHQGDLFHGLPVVALVGKSTSAGNVFLAAALQDNDRAVVVGEPTVGETYVSSFVPIPGRDDQLKLATAVMHRGDGTPLLRSGSSPIRTSISDNAESTRLPNYIVPDHHVTQAPHGPAGHQPPTSDPMLAKAVEVLKTGAAQASSKSTEYQGS